jgi:hypothetical protein
MKVGTGYSRNQTKEKANGRRRGGIQVTNTGSMFAHTSKNKKGITTHIMACSGGDCTGSWEGVTSTTGSMFGEITDIVVGEGD